jgi:ADP-L-glycero-D-manno-heptose 6-epimerase
MILVTGGFGFIGSNLIKALNARGISEIIVVDDLTDGNKMMNLNGTAFGDYYDVDSFFDTFSDWDSVKFIFHEGAISSTRETNGTLLMKRNFEFSEKLLMKSFEHKIPFQYASSASVYGDMPANFRVSESASMYPQTPYAFSKYMFDKKIIKLMESEYSSKFEFNIQGLRYFNVYGENELHKGDQASPITKFTKQARETGKIKLFSGSESIFRDFVCVEDIVQAKIELAFNKMNSGIFNLGTGAPESFARVAEIIAHRENAKVETVPFPKEYQTKYQYWTCADMTKLRDAGIKTHFRSINEFFKI